MTDKLREKGKAIFRMGVLLALLCLIFFAGPPSHARASSKGVDSTTQGQIDAALSREAAAVRAKLPPSASVIALCVEGRMRSSRELAQMFPDLAFSRDRGVTFLIGGSYGLDEGLKNEAQSRLSMSPMTFPHHLARVMLLEQLYRAFQINGGTKYHK